MNRLVGKASAAVLDDAWIIFLVKPLQVGSMSALISVFNQTLQRRRVRPPSCPLRVAGI